MIRDLKFSGFCCGGSTVGILGLLSSLFYLAGVFGWFTQNNGADAGDGTVILIRGGGVATWLMILFGNSILVTLKSEKDQMLGIWVLLTIKVILMLIWLIFLLLHVKTVFVVLGTICWFFSLVLSGVLYYLICCYDHLETSGYVKYTISP